jgi:hypothetical protein
MAINKIPNYWYFNKAPSAETDDNSREIVQNLPATENLFLESEETQQNQSDDWNFQFDVSYFFTLIPCYQNGEAKITSQAFAVIDSHLTTQPDVLESEPIPFTHETPKADVIIGNFDRVNPKDLLLYQANDTISLDDINVSSVKEYKTLWKDKTSFFTKSQTCNLLNIQGKEQIVTVLLSGTQIGLDVYYFNNGQKVEWGASSLFDHGIGFSNIVAFDISVSEVLPNKTIEVVVIVSKSQNIQHTQPTSFQTNLIKLVINVSSKTFSLAANQKLVGFTPPSYFLLTNMVNQVYQSNSLVYLSYMSAENTLTIAVFQWDSTIYKQIWKDDYQISVPRYWYSYNAPLFYKNGNIFYFVHIFQGGHSSWPFYVEIYIQQNDGTLSKSKSIPFSNSELNPVTNFWGGIYTQDSLYLLQTSHIYKGDERYNLIVLYQVDEKNNKVNLLSTTPTYLNAFGLPMIAISNYNINAQPPKLTTLTESLQAVAILDAPPIFSLIDYSNGANYPSMTYSFEQQHSSTKNVETKTERSKSDSLGAGLEFFDALKIGGDINKKIEDSSGQAHVSEFGLIKNTEITSVLQDMVVFLGITFNIYEYPIAIAGKPSGYFLFVMPASEPHLIINTGQLMFRKTSHQIGNLLSYPTMKPTDVYQVLYTNEFSINANESFISTLNYSDLQTSSSSITTTTTVSKSLSLGIEFPIVEHVAGSINAKLEDSYTVNDINISSFTIENSFTLKIQIQKLLEHDANKYFSVQPYFYIDNSNILRCSYRVDVPTGGSSAPTYWKDYYKYPDFGMVMPFHTDPFKNDSKYLISFDIETKPSNLIKDLKELDISVTVHNWSLVSGLNVAVGFYYMKEFKRNPSKDELVEIGRQTLELIRPRESQVASIKWENPYLVPVINAVPIYVVIDPDNVQTEMSRDNNFAQMNYPISSLKDGTGIRQFLSENAVDGYLGENQGDFNVEKTGDSNKREKLFCPLRNQKAGKNY